MGAYLGYILTAFAPSAHEPEVRVDSQNDIACCTSTVIYDDSDSDDVPRHYKR